jgi:hypothetical protein
MAFKMKYKGFPKNGDPKKEQLTSNDPKKEKLDNRSNIIQRIFDIKMAAKGRKMSKSEQDMLNRLQTMLDQLK